MGARVWTVRSTDGYYESFSGVFASEEAARASLSPKFEWRPTVHDTPDGVFTPSDPFQSTEGSLVAYDGRISGEVYVIEPWDPKS